ncbi:MAG: hypothetical protein QOG63_1277 [Thermoleophilaceae bacterium]|nr:hypothetical protein [Thermoleophilaceae bacterium]
MPLRSLLVALLLALVAAPAASASTLKLDRGSLLFSGGKREANQVRMSDATGAYVVEDLGAPLGVTGAICSSSADGVATCPAGGFGLVNVDLGDGDDTLDASTATVATVRCGPGTDSVTVRPGTVAARDCETVVVAEPPPVPPEEPPVTPLVPEGELAAGPPVTISSAAVAIDSKGRLPVEVSCPVAAASGCAGRVTVALPDARSGAAAKLASGANVLGQSRRFQLSAGQTKVVPVRLDRRAARIIKRRGGGRRRVKLSVTVEVRSAGGTQSATRTITVKLRRR